VRLPAFLRRRDRPEPTIDGVLVLRRGRPYDPAWDRWRPARRWPGVLISAAATAGLLIAIAYHYEVHATAAPKPVFSKAPHAKLAGPYIPPVTPTTPGVQHFSATGTDDNAYGVRFASPGGLLLWVLECPKCTANFIVTVRNRIGDIVDVPVNSIGRTYARTSMANYARGPYTFDVVADAPWSIELINESTLRPVKTPFTYVSTGSSILGPFPASAATILMGYQENLGQLFSVQVVDGHDDLIDNAQSTIRNSFVRVTVPHPSNPYFLVVSGGGVWLISVS